MEAGWPNTFNSLIVAAGPESSLRRTYPMMESSHSREMKCSVPPPASYIRSFISTESGSTRASVRPASLQRMHLHALPREAMREATIWRMLLLVMPATISVAGISLWILWMRTYSGTIAFISDRSSVAVSSS